MATSGPLGCGTGADDATVGTVAWSNPGNITADDISQASAMLNNETTHYLKATNFGHAVPAGAIIQGVKYTVLHVGSGVTDSAVRFVNAGTIGSTNKGTGTDWGLSETTAEYGGSADTWDETLTATAINDSTTGVVISATHAGLGSASVDYVTSTVTYITGGLMFYQKRALRGGMLQVTDGVN